MEDNSVSSLLKVCYEFVGFTKECPACIEGFLGMYLKTWDGVQNRESIFDLLVNIVPSAFEGISLLFLG